VSEALNKLAIWLNSRWPARVVSINWGPWNASGGMVTPELMEQFVNAGVQMVDPEAGCKAFVNELLFGSKSEPEVIWGGPINVETKLPRTECYFPLLERSGLSRTHVNGSMVSIIETGPSIDTYLRHHQLDNQLVMPFAMVLELCAEAALTHYPDHQLTAIRDVQRLRGIVYNGDKTRTLHVASHKVAALDDGILLDISVNCQGQAPESCYRAKAELTRSGPRLSATRRLDLMNPREFELPVQAAYESWLFHGPLFAGIKSIECIGDNGIIATLKGSSPQTMMSPETHGSWLIDPVIVDSALQLLILWARSYLDATPLPSRLGSYHIFGRLPAGGSVRCEAEIEYQPGNPTLNASLLLYDSGGRKIGWLEDMEVTVSRALNRLGKATSLCAGGVQ
jgi:Polyketide synthase dehydratase N-terminal domain